MMETLNLNQELAKLQDKLVSDKRLEGADALAYMRLIYLPDGEDTAEHPQILKNDSTITSTL